MKEITVETAKLALDKGIKHSTKRKYYLLLENDEFDDPRSGDTIIFHKEGETICTSSDVKVSRQLLGYAYTQSDLQDYIRINHKLYIEITYWEHGINLCIKRIEGHCKSIWNSEKVGEIYEDVLEEGIQKALELI